MDKIHTSMHRYLHACISTCTHAHHECYTHTCIKVVSADIPNMYTCRHAQKHPYIHLRLI